MLRRTTRVGGAFRSAIPRNARRNGSTGPNGTDPSNARTTLGAVLGGTASGLAAVGVTHDNYSNGDNADLVFRSLLCTGSSLTGAAMGALLFTSWQASLVTGVVAVALYMSERRGRE